MIFGFENEEIMGKTIGQPLTYRKLVNRKAITPYEIMLLAVKRDDIKQYVNENTWVRSVGYFDDQERQTRFLASVIALDKAFKRGVSKRVLSFHSQNDHAKNFEQSIINLRDNKIFSSFAELDFIGRCEGGQATTNKIKLDMFSNAKSGIISNARVLTEGVSIPAIDTVIFCDPKRSVVDQVQGISRAIRLYKGKHIARILMPVIIDEDNSIEQESYQYMVEVMSRLAEFDEVLWDEIQAAVATQGRTRLNTNRVVNTDEIEYEDISLDDFYNNLSLAFYTRESAGNGFWDEERIRTAFAEFPAGTKRADVMNQYFRAGKHLDDGDFGGWDAVAPHIVVAGKSWDRRSFEEIVALGKSFTGTQEEFFRQYPKVKGRINGLSQNVGEERKYMDMLMEVVGDLPSEKIRWKYISSEEVIERWLQHCTTKKEARQVPGVTNLSQKIARYKDTNLKEAFEFYQALPNTPTGLKSGQRRGGGWSHK
jgi:hypothetical protein